MIHINKISQIMATGMAALLTVCLTACSASDGIDGTDSNQPLKLKLSATLVPQSSATLTRGTTSTVAVKIPDASTLVVNYAKTSDQSDEQISTYTTTANTAGGYALALGSESSDIIYKPASAADYTLQCYRDLQLLMPTERTDGTSGTYDVPFYAYIQSATDNPAVTKDLSAGTASYTLPLQIASAGIKLNFALAPELLRAGYTYKIDTFEPKLSTYLESEKQIDHIGSITATSSTVIGSIIPQGQPITKGTVVGIVTVTYTNDTEGTTDTRRLQITLPADLTPDGGQLYTYSVALSRSEALASSAVTIAAFTPANGENGEDIVRGNINLTYDLTSLNNVDADVTAKFAEIKTRINAFPSGTRVALTVTGVKAIPANAFYNSADGIACPNLFSVDLPDATSIGAMAFAECSNLAKVNLPNVETIGNQAFTRCNCLASVDLPKATTIGNQAFAFCSRIASVNLPIATEINQEAFSGCENLASVDLPQVSNLGNDAFAYCPHLSTLKLTAANTITYSTTAFQGSNTANCNLYLNADKKADGTGSPLVSSEKSWAGLTWKSITFK